MIQNMSLGMNNLIRDKHETGKYLVETIRRVNRLNGKHSQG